MFTKIFPVIALLASLPLFATAQESASKSPDVFPPGVVMHDTILAAHLDLTQIDAQAMTQILSQLSGRSEETPLGPLADGLVHSLRGAGAKDVYVTVPGRALLQGGVCILIPCDDKDTVSKTLTGLLDAAPHSFEFRVVKTDRAVVVCPAMMASDFQDNQPVTSPTDRPEFNAGRKAMAGFPHQLVVSLPKDIREELTLLWPEKMGAYDPTGISPRRWIASAHSLSLGWSLPPKMAIELQIQSANHAGAVACEQEMSKLLTLIPPGMPRPTIEVDADTVLIHTDPEKLQAFLAPLMRPAQQDAQRRQTMNNFKQLALAMHNFHSNYGFFPGKYTVDEEGHPLLSWRVALLPYLDQAPLYAKFKLDEPWDSEHNRPLADQMPEVFGIAGDDLQPGMCRIRVPVFPGSLWAGSGPPRKLSDITDGTSNTIWVAAAPKSAAVSWTQPDDWELDEAKLKEQFFADQPYTVVGYADGSVHVSTPAIADKTLKSLLTMAGGEVIPQEEIK